MTKKTIDGLKKQIIGCILVFVALGCISCTRATYSLDNYPDMPLLDTEEIAQLTADEEPLVKYLVAALFEEKGAEARKRGKKYRYYIKVLGKNPAPNILANLHDERISLRPASAGRHRDGIVYDPDMDWSELYSISSIEIDDGNAKVQVSFYKHGLGSVGYEYRLIRKEGVWEFVGSKLLWIS